MEVYDGEALNILHTVGLDTLYPVIRIKLEFSQRLSKSRFERALKGVCKVVPEILCRYNIQTNQWFEITDKVSDLVIEDVRNVDEHAKEWDLMKNPQLRVYWNETTTGTRLIFYVSHILTDGAGSKQLLYLISKAYTDGENSIQNIRNNQSTEWLEELVKKYQNTNDKKDNHLDELMSLPQIKSDATSSLEVGSVTLTKLQTEQLIQATHLAKLTVNDVVMGAFGRVMQSFAGTQSINLVCPTDLRQFNTTANNVVQIANFTSRYTLAIDTELTEPFPILIRRIHQKMVKKKNHRQCFDALSSLLRDYHSKSVEQLQTIVDDNYQIREIAYTNFGVIDKERLNFGDISVKSLIITGGFRRAPMFQIATGTFDDRVTLAFNMNGTKNEYLFGMALARNVATIITNFSLETLSIEN